MKSLLKIFCIIVFAGCSIEPVPDNEPNQKELSQSEKIENKLHELTPEQFKVIRIEDCEYIVFKDHLNANQGYGFMAHKGNCKNPIHCHNQSDIEPKDSLLNMTEQSDSMNISQ